MKKLLTIFGALGLTATTSMAVVACQVEIQGKSLEELAQKISEANPSIVVANPPLEAPGLKKEVVKHLTKTLVKHYGMDAEGYFRDSAIKTITIADWKLLDNGQLIPNSDIAKEKLEGEQDAVVLIEKSEFKFRINFTFDSIS